MATVTIRMTVLIEAKTSDPVGDGVQHFFSMTSLRLPNGVNILPLFNAEKQCIENVMDCIADAVVDGCGDEDP